MVTLLSFGSELIFSLCKYNNIQVIILEDKSLSFEEESVYDAVSWQVLAVLMMRHGVKVEKKIEEKIICEIRKCSEYQMGHNFGSKPVFLKSVYDDAYGVGAMDRQDANFGENSSVNRILERTKNIKQLVEDFKSYCKNGFKPFEREDCGLIETFTKKMSIS